MVHEIGHTLGAALFKPGGDYHSESGLMVESINHPNFHEDFIQENIDDIVHEGHGPVENKDDKKGKPTVETNYERL